MSAKKWIWLAVLLSLIAGCAPAAQVPPEPAAPENDPAPMPAAEPEAPEPPDPMDARVTELLGAMTREQKIAQLFFVSPEALTGFSGSVTAADESVRAAFRTRPVGGIILNDENLAGPDQTRALLSGLQEISRETLGLPLLLGVDEEGGTVARVSGSGRFDTGVYPDMAAVESADRAREIGAEMGEYLRELGFNLDFAPVADVLTNPDNTVVRRRAFSTDPAAVTAMCAAFSEGLQSRGVMACYKHFPGHGATAEDSHEDFARCLHEPEELIALDLPPFCDAAGREIPFIMVGHITLPNTAQQALPASVSCEITTELLRGELGFRGVAITDSLDMGAITAHYPAGEAAVQAVLAGDDMLLVSEGFDPACDAVTQAVSDGTIPPERLDEAVGRILRVKLAWQEAQGVP